VLLSLLLGNQPPRATVQLLVRTAELFGIAEGTARTALSRMASAGEVRSRDGYYELSSPELLVRQHRQSASRAAVLQPWSTGRWVQVVVTADGRRSATQRAQLRRSLRNARLAELREGVWLRPDNLGASDQLAELGSDLTRFAASPQLPDAELVRRLWDLDTWSTRATQLVQAMERLVESLEAHHHGVLAEGFVISADVLRHFQADPLLPVELLPAEWPGLQLRRVYDRYDAAYRSMLAHWFRSQR
jgi:phenylacetic acid degradation operon negative regulatory protein